MFVLIFGVFSAIILWWFKNFLYHPIATLILTALFTSLISAGIAALILFVKKKRTGNHQTDDDADEEPAPVRENRRLSPDEVTTILNEKVVMMFGDTATWKWKSEREREETFTQGQGFIVVTNDNGLTTILVDILMGTVKLVFADFEPLQEIRVDYSLMAFEWLNSHLEQLMALFSNAINNGDLETVLAAEMLPERGAWENLCEEIEENSDGFVASICDNGIRVTFPAI